MEALALVREMPIRSLLAGQLSDDTRRVYNAALVHFFGRSGLDLHEVTRDHVVAYRNSLIERYSPSTVALRLSVLSQVFEEAKICGGLVEKNPLERLRRPKVPQESTTEGRR